MVINPFTNSNWYEITDFVKPKFLIGDKYNYKYMTLILFVLCNFIIIYTCYLKYVKIVISKELDYSWAKQNSRYTEIVRYLIEKS